MSAPEPSKRAGDASAAQETDISVIVSNIRSQQRDDLPLACLTMIQGTALADAFEALQRDAAIRAAETLALSKENGDLRAKVERLEKAAVRVVNKLIKPTPRP